MKPAPRSQGATLTAWELAQQKKFSHQIIADNAAGHLMQRGEIDLVIRRQRPHPSVRTGEVTNKIGTYTKASLPPPRRSVSMTRHSLLHHPIGNLKRGFDIPIEERHEAEVLGALGRHH